MLSLSLIRAAGSPEWFTVTGSHNTLWSRSAIPTKTYKQLSWLAYIYAVKTIPRAITTYLSRWFSIENKKSARGLGALVTDS